jgi:hypothetical protein
MTARGISLAELTADATHSADRVALYEQKLYAGRGDMRRLTELKREAAGAADRLELGRARVAADAAADAALAGEQS